MVVHQPIEVRLFARLTRRRAKNDALDARLIAAATARVDTVRAASDRRLVELLAQRMAVVDRVIARKQQAGLPALIPGRVEEVILRVRGEADRLGVSADLCETVWRSMMGWVVDYEAGHLHGG